MTSSEAENSSAIRSTPSRGMRSTTRALGYGSLSTRPTTAAGARRSMAWRASRSKTFGWAGRSRFRSTVTTRSRSRRAPAPTLASAATSRRPRSPGSSAGAAGSSRPLPTGQSAKPTSASCRLLCPGQDKRLDLAKRAHVLDRLVDAVQRIAGGQHRLEVVAGARAPHELERLPELADVGGLHRCERPAELADDGVASAGPQEVEPLGERVRRAGQLEDHVGAEPAGELAHPGQPRFRCRKHLDRYDPRRAPALGQIEPTSRSADDDELTHARVIRNRCREQPERPGALDHHALVRFDAAHAVEGV